MACALFDAQRFIVAYRHPRDARRAQIVERDVFSLSVGDEKLWPRDTGSHEMTFTKKHGALVVLGQPEHA